MAEATLGHGIIDDRIATSRVVKSIEVDIDPAKGKHRAVKLTISNKGHVCYVTRALKPRAFPRKAPVGCTRSLVIVRSGCDGLETDHLCAAIVACAETKVAKLGDLVCERGLAGREFVGRDRGFRTKRCLLLPGRSSASVGDAGADACMLK